MKKDYKKLAGQIEEFQEQLGLIIGENIKLKRLVTSLERKYVTLFKSTQDEKLKMRKTMASLQHKYLVVHKAVTKQSNLVHSKSLVRSFTKTKLLCCVVCL